MHVLLVASIEALVFFLCAGLVVAYDSSAQEAVQLLLQSRPASRPWRNLGSFVAPRRFARSVAKRLQRSVPRLIYVAGRPSKLFGTNLRRPFRTGFNVERTFFNLIRTSSALYLRNKRYAKVGAPEPRSCTAVYPHIYVYTLTSAHLHLHALTSADHLSTSTHPHICTSITISITPAHPHCHSPLFLSFYIALLSKQGLLA